MSEYEYYTNLPYTNYCKAKGYEEKIDTEASMLRMGFYRIHQSLVEKPLTIKEFWPLASDKESVKEKIVVSREMIDKIKKIHNLR